MQNVLNKETVQVPISVPITGTPSEVLVVDVATYGLLTVGVFNSLGGGQTLSCTIFRRQSNSSQWKESYLADLQSIADGVGRSVDIDCRGAFQIRVMATASGVGGNIEIEASKLRNPW
jgi:hypothetical protein